MPVYQDSKTKKWYFSCYYVDWQGERRRKVRRGFSLAREAKEAEREFLMQYALQSDMTFKALYDVYLADCKPRLKAGTYNNKMSNFENSILPFFCKKKINEITPAHVRQWQNEIIQRHKPTSQRQLHGQLSAIFNFAIKFYGLQKNPARAAGSIGSLQADAAQYWTLEEFHKVAEQEKNLTFLAAHTLLFYSGIRAGELLAMNVEDYDPAAKTIRISKTLFRSRSIDYITSPKTKKSNRTIVIPNVAASLLDKYIASLCDPKPKDRLFYTLNVRKLYYFLRVAAKQAGVKCIRVHDLRHSHASLLINNGVNIKALSERLGHANIQTTLNIYGHLYEQQDEQIAAKLDKLYDNSIKTVSQE